jgi:hypothetical protein
MTGLAHWKIGTEVGRSTIEINGEDISGHVSRVALILNAREHAVIPSLQVELVGGGTLEGVGIVKVLPDEILDDVSARQAVIAFLDALDPTEVERRMTAGPMNSGVGFAVITTLKQMAVS